MPVVIKLKGMPWEVTSRDIKEFFRDSKIAEHDIHLAPNEDGKACGVGFACFYDDEDARRAMQRNGAYLGKRYIDLFLSSQAEMEKALRDGVPNPSISDLRPPRKDIRASRGGFRGDKPARDRSRSPHDRSSGRFSKRDDSGSHRSHSSSSRPDDRGRDGGGFRSGGFSGRGGGFGKGESTRGKPRGGIRGRGVRGGGPRGRHSFSSSRSDDRPSRGGGSESSFFDSQSSKGRFESSLQPLGTGTSSSLFLKLSGLPYTAQNTDIQNFLKGVNVTEVHIIPNKGGPYAGRSSGSAFIECATQNDCIKALQRHGQYLGRRYINVVRSSLNEIVSTLNIDLSLLTGQLPMDFSSRGLEVPSRSQVSSNFPSSSLSGLSEGGPSAADKTISLVAASANINLGDIKDGCVVGIRNLPSTTTTEEVLHFFRDFPAIPDSVRIHYLDVNRCSGDAMLTLVSNEEARRAIRQLSGKQFGSRKIELFLL